MPVFVIIKKVGIMKNVDVNVKELIDKGICDKEFIWNPSDCDCECYNRCDVGKYLDYEIVNAEKKWVFKLVEECSENVDGNEIINNGT